MAPPTYRGWPDGFAKASSGPLRRKLERSVAVSWER